MSVCYDIVCDECKEKLWIGQSDHIYSASEHITNLALFLHKHIGHNLRFLDEDGSGAEYIDFEHYTYFGKGCIHFTGQWEDAQGYTTHENKEYEPILNHCINDLNKIKCEGNCNKDDCPLKENI